jgi:hypothetical protein
MPILDVFINFRVGFNEIRKNPNEKDPSFSTGHI